MRANFKPFYILSGKLPGDSPAEAVAKTDTLAAALASLGFKTKGVAGCYKGETEPSVLAIDYSYGEGERDALRLARQYGQESILSVGSDRAASLVYCEDGRRESLGRWREIPAYQAAVADAFTEYSGRYFVAGWSVQ